MILSCGLLSPRAIKRAKPGGPLEFKLEALIRWDHRLFELAGSATKNAFEIATVEADCDILLRLLHLIMYCLMNSAYCLHKCSEDIMDQTEQSI
jgi:hypothetical protein